MATKISFRRAAKKAIRQKSTTLRYELQDFLEYVKTAREVVDPYSRHLRFFEMDLQIALDQLIGAQKKGRQWWKKA